MAGLLARIVASSDPALVFESLAAVAVPAVADECLVDLVQDDAHERGEVTGDALPGGQDGAPRSTGALSVAAATPSPEASGATLSVNVAGRAEGDAPGYRVTVTFRWEDRSVSSAHQAAARLLSEHAVALLRHERLATELERQTHKSEQLTEALVTSRQIGQALGIVMCTYKLTSEQAFDLLRAVSQKTHRKLREVADDVNFTGTLTVSQLEPAAPRRLRVVESSV